MIARRKLLKLIGLSPLAAKAAADKEAESLVLRNWAAPALASGSANVGSAAPHMDGESVYTKAGSYIRVFGIPDHAKARMWETAKHVTALDPDIAAKRSWSLSVKIQEQRQRNYARITASASEWSVYEQGQKAFQALTGWRWPW